MQGFYRALARQRSFTSPCKCQRTRSSNLGEEGTEAFERDTPKIVLKSSRDSKPRPSAKMILRNDYNQIYAAAEKQSKMLGGLRRSLSEA